MTALEKQFDPHAIGLEAYAFFYPLITMELTRRQTTNIAAGQAVGRGPMNTFSHVPAFPTAEFRMVVRPNFDTLYSSAWLDLSDGPVMLSAPDTAGRYYLLPIMDMWTDVFAAPGWRTTGTGAGRWLITPPGWDGAVPDGLERITAPTSTVWVIGRTQTNGPADYDAVHAVQAGYGLATLTGEPFRVPPIDPSVDMTTEPLHQVNALSAVEYFTLAAELLRKHPPHLTDWSQVARLRYIGIVPGQPFDAGSLSAEVLTALEKVPTEARAQFQEIVRTSARVTNGWAMNTDTMGVYGDFYTKRAAVCMVGLGANQAEDAIYPLQFTDADGNPTDGSHAYLLHFNDLPPVAAFWSVTMYDGEGFQIANPLDRYAIGDRDELQYNQDGSLDLWVQAASPGAERESNWLPAPAGAFSLCMRLYGPEPEALDGRWNPPALRRA